MRILVAPQEFKGTLTAVEAAEAIADGLRSVFPTAEIELAPMADGGPGTAAALLAASGGEWRQTPAHDALMRPIEGRWALLADGSGVIECAEASGLLRLAPEELDPRRASTFGTGELIAAALDAGCRRITLGLGGSATNDGGAGMAQALGFRLLDSGGSDIDPGGAALGGLARIDAGGAHAGIARSTFLAATDVTNPLFGPEGASELYGPQKGADPAAVRELDAALRRFAEVIRQDLGVDVSSVAGAGAAGGLGAGAVAFLAAKIGSGAEVVAKAARLDERVLGADIVITGEGRLDEQTVFGKTPAFVARLARAAGKAVVCIAGSLGPGHERAEELFDAVETAGPAVGADSAGLLREAAVRAVLKLGSGQARRSL